MIGGSDPGAVVQDAARRIAAGRPPTVFQLRVLHDRARRMRRCGFSVTTAARYALDPTCDISAVEDYCRDNEAAVLRIAEATKEREVAENAPSRDL